MSFLLRAASSLRSLVSCKFGLLQEPLFSSTRLSNLPAVSMRQGSTSFFGHLTQEQLWKSATSVSNAGRKRGRARGRKLVKNLNRGQQLGVGETNMVWPGLNSPLFRGREIVHQQQLSRDPTRKEKIHKIRDSIERFRQLRVTPMERGWSGNRMPGRSIGPPDPIGEDKFDKFDCKVLEMKQVANMTGTVGRKRRFSILVVTGNKQGLMAVALAKAIDAKAALRKARNLSIKKLRYVERFEGRTIFHDFHHQIDSTALFVQRRPEGFGFVGHRAIREICDAIGIRDLYAKVEGRANLQKTVKCFIAGLEKQEVHQQLSERKRLHVVEFKRENHFFPTVLASPTLNLVRQSNDEIGEHENVKFPDLYAEGNVRLIKPKKPPFYTKLPSWQKRLDVLELKRDRWPSLHYHWMQRELKGADTPLYQNLREPDLGHLPFSKPVKIDFKKQNKKK